jgi:23S rRNA (cytidine1920-2'-O)/16S rRNA (cytidine1409-2'-O)-methyltransferase
VAKKSAKKIRADIRLVELGLVTSHDRALAMLIAGNVFLGETRIDKPGTLVPGDGELTLRQAPRFVSRGGYKLEGALDALGVAVAGLVCVDVGASTGGFTDCLLQRGATRVFAVDVGHGLLAHKLVTDPRVTVMDKTNARHLEAKHFGAPIDLAVVDASFIGIGKLAPGLALILPAEKWLLAMIKPQFEVAKAEAQKSKGVISDPALRDSALNQAMEEIVKAGFTFIRGCDSILPGPKGNVEYFCLAQRC